jgi:arginyl-tRNA synthetase
MPAATAGEFVARGLKPPYRFLSVERQEALRVRLPVCLVPTRTVTDARAMNLLKLVQQPFRAALGTLVPDPEPYVEKVKATENPRFGDYQANCALVLAKALKQKPPDLARTIVERLPLGDFLQPAEIAGGFINVRLRDDWLATRVQEMARDPSGAGRLGVAPAEPPRTFVIDYSSPNVAKPMHVGHLRSTIIGDALARLLRFLGHKVITDNHLGDWGAQFGMLLYGYKHFRDEEALKKDPVREMVRLYVQVRQLVRPVEDEEEGDEAQEQYTPEQVARAREVRDAYRQETAKLHAGDPENVRLWQQFMPWCLKEIEAIYRRLDVHFDATLGESFYNPMLPAVVQDVLDKGLAQVSDGAVAIFYPGEEKPALVRTKAGAFLYMASDLATVRHRAEQWHPNAILYVVGAPQALHFKHLFDAARRWGYADIEFQHIAFGSILQRGADGRTEMFRTRAGRTVELGALLDEAASRAAQVYEASVAERRERGQEVPELTPEQKRQIAEVVGLGAVTYADLSQNRTSDYIFSWEKMLAMDGNTATYMQYAYARIRSIFREGEEDERRFRSAPPRPSLNTAEERALALQLLRLHDALDQAAAEYKPNAVTSYLWDLARTYSGFYQNCPVLKAETPELRDSRLLLCDLTARVIRKGLDLLGIRTVERM